MEFLSLLILPTFKLVWLHKWKTYQQNRERFCPEMGSYGQKYFISFIDDYSHFMYFYLHDYRNKASDAFKVFKVEV